ncbi:P-type conjugative transfer protein TrbJ [Yersinia rohdei]|uniref:P-type conjugative transfer protein TrbJ n=1 Tax=Yersinia rohdei TaxID=29485 RepID=UPI0025AB0ACB|nr:P-type conjugative transfer protein TrbJ [Yersinia rohdei]MDN0096257.1 P-type conjugative transfer protein TrbJ [Yersinia rohdei]
MQKESIKNTIRLFSKSGRCSVLSIALTSSILGVGLSVTPVPAYAIYCSNCSTFYQQMFEYAEAVNTALNTAEQLSTQIQQYNNMVTQGISLPSSMYGSITSDLQRVASIYNRSQALGRNVANLESQFNTQFPGYETYLQKFIQSSGKATDMMPDRYEKWSVQGFDNAKTAMQAAGMNTSTFADEDAHLDQLVSRSQSAAGRMQAIQAGNEISASNVQQLQKLRDLVATQITLQGNYMAQETERQATSDAAIEQFQSRQNTRGGVKGY